MTQSEGEAGQESGRRLLTPHRPGRKDLTEENALSHLAPAGLESGHFSPNNITFRNTVTWLSLLGKALRTLTTVILVVPAE